MSIKKKNLNKKKNSTKEENLIHIKLEYPEARIGKKDLLSSEIHLLKSSEHLSQYKKFRLEELDTKIKIMKKIRKIKKNLGWLGTKFPKIKIPKSLQKNYIQIKEEQEENIPKIKTGKIEDQLLEIQKKLKLLEG